MLIGNIGYLPLTEEDNKFYVRVEDCYSYWSEIPKYLYDALVKYQKELNASK